MMFCLNCLINTATHVMEVKLGTLDQKACPRVIQSMEQRSEKNSGLAI